MLEQIAAVNRKDDLAEGIRFPPLYFGYLARHSMMDCVFRKLEFAEQGRFDVQVRKSTCFLPKFVRRFALVAPMIFGLQTSRGFDHSAQLPDGTVFQSWEEKPSFTRTYYVDGSSPCASDQNPGTKRRPFATINRAAQVLEPGERVVIAAGIYSERIRPARGGASPKQMISYEARPGDRVILRGSRTWKEPWTSVMVPAANHKLRVWQTDLEPRHFEGPNPFALPNVTERQFEVMNWAAEQRGKVPFTLVRGLVFQDGRRLTQVAATRDLTAKAGTYWVDRVDQRLWVRLFDDVEPPTCSITLTTQDTVFAPTEMGLGYIRVRGLTVEQVGGPWPFEQVGAISTTRGHHWIIEDCTVRQVNGVGIDVGGQHIHWPQPAQIGFHIVRRNVVTDCGISGICGLGPAGMKEFGLLIEDNAVLRTAWHNAEALWENAGIKTHRNVRCLIRRNLVADTYHGPGIWMDWGNHASRCTQNIILRTTSRQGAIFVEISKTPNLVDNNIIWDTKGSGIYEHDASMQIFAHNLIGNSTGPAFYLRGKVTNRKIDRAEMNYGSHRVMNNLLHHNAMTDLMNGQPSTVAGQVSSGFSAKLEYQTLELTISSEGVAPNSTRVPEVDVDFFGKKRGKLSTSAGPFRQLPLRPTKLPLWHGPMPDLDRPLP